MPLSVCDDDATYAESTPSVDYLQELLSDRTTLSYHPGLYSHVENILEKEIFRVRAALFSSYGVYKIKETELPVQEGPKVLLQDKVFMPTDSQGSFNFVGRILGPDGSTAKYLQQCFGTKIMVRGRGSMRDRRKEEANIGKPNWEHLNEDLHVLLTVEDTENRGRARLNKAREYISMFIQESMKGSDRDDKVKQMQLMELASRREVKHANWLCSTLLGVPSFLPYSKLLNAFQAGLPPVPATSTGGASGAAFVPHLSHPPFPYPSAHLPPAAGGLPSHWPPFSPPVAPAAAAAALNAAILMAPGSSGVPNNTLTVNPNGPHHSHPSLMALAALQYANYLNENSGYVTPFPPSSQALSQLSSFEQLQQQSRANIPTSTSVSNDGCSLNVPPVFLTSHHPSQHPHNLIGDEQLPQPPRPQQLGDVSFPAFSGQLRAFPSQPIFGSEQSVGGGGVSTGHGVFSGLYGSATGLIHQQQPQQQPVHTIYGLISPHQPASAPPSSPSPMNCTTGISTQLQPTVSTGQRQLPYSASQASHTSSQSNRCTLPSGSHDAASLEATTATNTEVESSGGGNTGLTRKTLNPTTTSQRPLSSSIAGTAKNGKNNGRAAHRINGSRDTSWSTTLNTKESEEKSATVMPLTKPMSKLEIGSAPVNGANHLTDNILPQSNGSLNHTSKKGVARATNVNCRTGPSPNKAT